MGNRNLVLSKEGSEVFGIYWNNRSLLNFKQPERLFGIQKTENIYRIHPGGHLCEGRLPTTSVPTLPELVHSQGQLHSACLMVNHLEPLSTQPRQVALQLV